MEITLAKAFVVRKRLERKMEQLYHNIINENIIYEVSENSENKNFDALERYEKYVLYTDLMSQINTAIAIANVKGDQQNCAKSILTQIEALKSQEKIATRYREKLERFEPVRKVFDPHVFNKNTNTLGDDVVNYYNVVINAQNIADNEKVLMKRIQDLEDKLSEVNHTVKVELSDFVKEALEKDQII